MIMVYPDYEMQNLEPDELSDAERLGRALRADMDDASLDELEAASDLLDRVLQEYERDRRLGIYRIFS
tara:strand:- start:127 stop:330 length:204 start_codon:yes stop_codon:yes gene_type:complete